jgi:fumarate reductase flavoprotein subunit
MINIKTDIVVIGGGTAGLSAALTALQKGVPGVIVLEKRLNYGGNSSMAGGSIFGAESRLQKQEGKIVSRDGAFQEVIDFAHLDRINLRLVQTLIDRSGETIDWLENQGMQFQLVMDNEHLFMGKFTAELLKKASPDIMQFSLAMEILADKIKEIGGKILLRTAAKRILCDNNGKISGVLAYTRTGEEINISCDAVILTPGGFTGNKELLKKYFDYDDFATAALPLQGDGIKMAEEAGAYLEEYATLCQHFIQPYYVGLSPIKNQPKRGLLTGPYAVWVNAKGERFYDAAIVCNIRGINSIILRQPGKVAYVIFDDKFFQAPLNAGPGPGGGGIISLEELYKLRNELKEEACRGKNVYMSDSWDGIAGYLRAPLKVLKNTIDKYNIFCDRESDETFGKDKQFLLPLRTPPYYAIKLQIGMVEAIGPVRINERMEVLNKQQDAIPGFYAAGTITSGWCGHDYHLSGTNLGFGTTGGRIAGENAAEYLSLNSR